MVDLRTCKPGDKLKSKHGLILEYVRPMEDWESYDHEVKYPDGSSGSRTHSGHVFRHNRLDADHDIVEVCK